jgi:outer membrane protein assembly factor BamB
MPGSVDPMNALEDRDVGLPVLTLNWRFQVADRTEDLKPQEFSSPALDAAPHPADSILYIGSQSGLMHALSAATGELIWKRQVGSISSRPIVFRGRVYVGTDDGSMVCLDAVDGEENWRYSTRGPVLQPPVVSDDLVLFSNEADHVYALDRETGKFRWQYKSETPEEFTLRGHAGVAIDGELVFAGFADGTFVALRAATGSVAWIKSLKGEAERFVDVDATPVVAGERVFASSSGGGVFALDKTTGLILWRLRLPGAGPLTADDERLYVAAADHGIYAIDVGGNILWRQGTQGGGEPAPPAVSGDYLLYGLSESGLFVADKVTGRVFQYFDPGYGVSAEPLLDGDHLFLMSNGGFLYSLEIEHFE